MKVLHWSKWWSSLHAMYLLSVHPFSLPYQTEFVAKVLILFLELSCLLDFLTVYWLTASLANKGSFISIVSSWINNLMKSPRVPSLRFFFLHPSLLGPIYLWSSQEILDIDSSMQVTSGVSSGFHSLDFVMLSHFTKNIWKLPLSSYFIWGHTLISFLYMLMML